MFIYNVFPRLFVTGPDKRKIQDIPRLNIYVHGIILSAVILLLFAGIMNFKLDLFGFITTISVGLSIMLLEKKYLPNTRRHLVTLCGVVGMSIVFAIYFGVTYL